MGHIEDIAVAKDQQGKKLGLKMIQALDYVAEQVGAYKVSNHGLRFASRTARLMMTDRVSWTARRQTRASMSSVVSGGWDWRWHITMRKPRHEIPGIMSVLSDENSGRDVDLSKWSLANSPVQ